MDITRLKHSQAYQLASLVDYVPGSVITKSILQKGTGNVSISSIDAGEGFPAKISPFDQLIQVIDGAVEIIINGQSTQLETGQIIIIPAHSIHKFRAKKRFKMLSTVIKSGYEDVSL